MEAVFPAHFDRQPPVQASSLGWYEMRPADGDYWRRVEELQARGGFWAVVRLVALHSAPGYSPLLALEVVAAEDEYFPALMLPGALNGTEWEGVPTHLSLCFEEECPLDLLEAALRRWGAPQRVWIPCERVTSGATCVLGRGGVAACPLLHQMHAGGSYANREFHISL